MLQWNEHGEQMWTEPFYTCSILSRIIHDNSTIFPLIFDEIDSFFSSAGQPHRMARSSHMELAKAKIAKSRILILSSWHRCNRYAPWDLCGWYVDARFNGLIHLETMHFFTSKCRGVLTHCFHIFNRSWQGWHGMMRHDPSWPQMAQMQLRGGGFARKAPKGLANWIACKSSDTWWHMVTHGDTWWHTHTHKVLQASETSETSA